MEKEIEKLDIGPIHKANMVLVLFDEKPAAEIDVFSWGDSPDKVEKVIKDSGLFYKKIVSKSSKVLATFCISKQKSLVDALAIAIDTGNDADYGRLMGYPETAIEAYVNKTSTTKYDTDRLFNFAFSQQNHIEEMKTVTRWKEAIKRHAPELYKESYVVGM